MRGLTVVSEKFVQKYARDTALGMNNRALRRGVIRQV